MAAEKPIPFPALPQKTSPYVRFLLAMPVIRSYHTLSTPAGPLQKGMLTLGGFFLLAAGVFPHENLPISSNNPLTRSVGWRIIRLLFAPRWISRKASGGVIFFPERVHVN